MIKRRLHISVCFLTLLLMSGAVYCQENQKKDNPVKSFLHNLTSSRKADSKNKAELNPTISIDKTFFDYGEVQQGEQKVAEFFVTNIGSGELRITDIKTSCGCTVVDYSTEPIKEGETSTIKVSYNTNIVGEIKRSIVVKSNDKATPKIVLQLIGNVVLKG